MEEVLGSSVCWKSRVDFVASCLISVSCCCWTVRVSAEDVLVELAAGRMEKENVERRGMAVRWYVSGSLKKEVLARMVPGVSLCVEVSVAGGS